VRLALLTALVLALAVAGCGDDPESEPLAPERVESGSIEANGLSQEDAAMARSVAGYLRRNASGAPFYDAIERVTVRDGVITIETTLRLDGRREGDARALCDLIQGSDEADFTPGHTVTGRGPKVTCRHRTD
jgi:hypothetical protein